MQVAAGNFSAALADAEKSAELRPHDPYGVFLATQFRRQAGRADWAEELARFVGVMKPVWSRAVGRFLLGELSEAALLEEAAKEGVPSREERQCEAFYYAGITRLGRGEMEGARLMFEQCLGTKGRGKLEYLLARAEMTRLKTK